MKTLILFLVLCGCSSITFGQNVKSEVIEFPGFRVEISNFISEVHQDLKPAQRSIPDTVFLAENPCEDDGYYIGGKIIKVIHESKGDHYELFYGLQAQLHQQVDPNQAEDNSGFQEKMLFQTEYHKAPAISSNLFQLPENMDVRKYQPVIRKKFAMKDTSVTERGEVFTHHFEFTKSGKLYKLDWENLYVKIVRLTDKKRTETKYLVVNLTEGCD